MKTKVYKEENYGEEENRRHSKGIIFAYNK